MPFVKLDCGILDSTLWIDQSARDIFITALLMATPYDSDEPLAQIEVNGLNPTGWSVPPGEYGFVPAAGPGIVRRALVADMAAGLTALERLGQPEANSRSSEFDGRRLVRIDGGFIVLNYSKYRERDYTAADRQKRRRLKLRHGVTDDCHGVTSHPVTQAEAEAEKDKEALRAFPADADEKGWKALGERLGIEPKTGEEMNAFKARIRRKAHGTGRAR